MLRCCLFIAFTVIFFEQVKPDSVFRKSHLNGFDYRDNIQAITSSELKLKIKVCTKATVINVQNVHCSHIYGRILYKPHFPLPYPVITHWHVHSHLITDYAQLIQTPDINRLSVLNLLLALNFFSGSHFGSFCLDLLRKTLTWICNCFLTLICYTSYTHHG